MQKGQGMESVCVIECRSYSRQGMESVYSV